jgi:hypothetical protein
MEAACLRIKFTPLLQNFPMDNSNHCLEIVPEISCIQNLDKIEWKTEENYIEYTIPMTYKVILRKKDVKKKEELDKVYHSCVDLLLPSSDTDLTRLGSGDMNRIFSDTFVLTKVSGDVEKCSIVFREPSKQTNGTCASIHKTVDAQTDINKFTSTSCQLATVNSLQCLHKSQKASQLTAPSGTKNVNTTSKITHEKYCFFF